MNRWGIGAGGLAAAPLAVVLLLSPFAIARPPQDSLANSALSVPPDIKRYRSWACANPKPALIPNRLAMLCAALPVERAEERRTNPHDAWYIRVFVNEKGRTAFFGDPMPQYPVGTVIVKEKLRTPNANAKPELLTVMTKRATGIDPSHNEWEYLVYDSSGRLSRGVTPQTRLGATTCRHCHESVRNQDYVFRSYISTAAYKKLK